MYSYDLFLNKAFQRHTFDLDTQNKELSGRHVINKANIFNKMIKQKIDMEKIYGIVTSPFEK